MIDMAPVDEASKVPVTDPEEKTVPDGVVFDDAENELVTLGLEVRAAVMEALGDDDDSAEMERAPVLLALKAPVAVNRAL